MFVDINRGILGDAEGDPVTIVDAKGASALFLVSQGPLQDMAPALLDYSVQNIGVAMEVAVFCEGPSPVWPGLLEQWSPWLGQCLMRV